MPKLAVRLLSIFRKTSLFYWKVRGKTEDDLTTQRVVSGQSWDEFCDTLKSAGAALSFPGAPRDPFNQAEGYRYLTRLVRTGLMAFVEHADPCDKRAFRVQTIRLSEHGEIPKLGYPKGPLW